MLPSVIVIGGQKCGTTSLFQYILQHPNVAAPRKKEPGFFDRRYDLGLDWYRRNFPLRVLHGDDITLEASTGYISYPHAPARIAESLPDVQLIALLRNPIDRAWSHYHHTVRIGEEPLPFDEAVEREDDRLGTYLERVESEPVYDETRNYYTYLSRGRYAEQLERWFENFSADRLLILSSDALSSDPMGCMDRVFEHAGLPRAHDVQFERHNEGTNYEKPMAPSTRARLKRYFEPHNQRLYEMLGRDLGWE